MRDNTEMPTIEFADRTDYSSLWALLHFANKGLDWGPDEGLTFDFHIDGGGVVTGSFYDAELHDTDDMVISLHEGGSPTGEFATVDADLITKLVYL